MKAGCYHENAQRQVTDQELTMIDVMTVSTARRPCCTHATFAIVPLAERALRSAQVPPTVNTILKSYRVSKKEVAELVGIEGGVVSGVINLELSGVEASDWRPRHDEEHHEV